MKGSPLIVLNYSIKNQANNNADIFIDGDIIDAPTQSILKDWFGDDTSTSYKSFRDMVNSSEADTFNVYINSGGGQITEAMAIHDLLVELQDKGKTVNTVGRGIIASAATYILMAGKKPSMSSNSWLMIHNVSGGIYGSVNEVENYAATMRRFNDSTTNFYQKTTGLSKTVIANMMDAETWMTADDAKSKNFISEVTGEVSFSQKIKPEQWQFSNSAVLNSYNSFTKKTDPIMETTKITEAINNGFNSLLEKLGLKDKANDENVKNAFTEFSNAIVNAAKPVPAGGKKGQFLAKASDADYDMEWIDDDDSDDSDDTSNKVNTIVKNSISESLKTVPENFTKAITDAQKGFAKTEDIKDMLNKTDFEADMKILKEDIINKISGADSTTDKNKDKRKKTENKWAYENLWPETN